MTTTNDLVMPKLGLTMTEGRVAEWKVRSGATFARGDILLVVETDKIANDVEAPAGGRLVEVLVPAGDVVAVGTPLARLQLDAPSLEVPRATVATPDVTPPIERNRPADAVPRDVASASSGARIIATPYARRLARDGAVQLKAIAGSGPGGRIRGADVVKVLADRSAQAVAKTQDGGPQASSGLLPPPMARPNVSVAAIVRDGSEFHAVVEKLRAGHAGVTLPLVVAYAAVRALSEPSRNIVRLGLQAADGSIVTLSARPSGLGALARARDEATTDPAGGDLLLLVAAHGINLFSPALPSSWPMALGLAVAGAHGRVEVSLALTYDQEQVDHDAAQRLLAAIGAWIDDPLVLLAG